MTYTLAGLTSMGTVTSEEITKNAGLFKMPIPMGNSNDNIILDLFGASMSIVVQGKYCASDGTIATFISQLEALTINQTSTKAYHSDKANANYNCYVDTVSWNSIEAGVNYVEYTINLSNGA